MTYNMNAMAFEYLYKDREMGKHFKKRHARKSGKSEKKKDRYFTCCCCNKEDIQKQCEGAKMKGRRCFWCLIAKFADLFGIIIWYSERYPEI